MADYYLNSNNGALFQASHAYNLNDVVFATSAATAARKQRTYVCTTAGTSAASEPAWNATVAGTTTSNTAVFTTHSPVTWAEANGFLNYLLGAVIANGDRVFVKNTHSESIAQPVLAAVGGVGSPIQILCVSDAAQPPVTLATGALIASTGAFNLGSNASNWYAYGVTFRSGDGSSGGANLTAPGGQTGFSSTFEQCTLDMASSGLSQFFPVTGGQTALYLNCTIKFGAASDFLNFGSGGGGFVVFHGGSLTGTAPTTAFTIQNGAFGQGIVLDGVDCSLVTGTLIGQSTGSGLKLVRLRNVKIGAGCTVFGGSREVAYLDELNELASVIDTTGTNYKTVQKSNVGDLTVETTLVRTGGATDGTTPISWKVVTTSGATRVPGLYHVTPWISFWNEGTAAVTVALEFLHDSLTALKDNEVWIEVEFMASAGGPHLTVTTDATDILAAGAAQTTSTATWTTTGMTNPNKQVASVSVTPAVKGIIRARLAVAKASYTLYVDPYSPGSGVTNNSRDYMAGEMYVNESGLTTTPTAAAIADAVWATALPGAYAAGTAGKLVGTNLDATISSRSTLTAQAVWDALTSALTTAGSIGKKLADWALGSDNRVLVSANAHTAGATVAAVTGAVGSVTGAVGSVTGNVGGNVTGSVASVVGAVGSVTGAVGSVTGNVGGNVVGSVASVVANVTVGDIVAAALARFFTRDSGTTYASAVAGSVVKEIATNAAGTAPPTAAAIADEVWDELLSDHVLAGSAGLALASAGAGTDPWATALPGAYGAGTAGKIVGTNLDATVSSRSTYAGGDTAGVTTLLARIASAITITAGKVDVNDKTGFSVSDIVAAALAKFFTTDSGKVYADAVAGSVVKEIADHAAASALTAQQVRDAMKLAPTAGTPAAGSVDLELDDIQAQTDRLNFSSSPGTDPGAAPEFLVVTLSKGPFHLRPDPQRLMR